MGHQSDFFTESQYFQRLHSVDHQIAYWGNSAKVYLVEMSTGISNTEVTLCCESLSESLTVKLGCFKTNGRVRSYMRSGEEKVGFARPASTVLNQAITIPVGADFLRGLIIPRWR